MKFFGSSVTRALFVAVGLQQGLALLTDSRLGQSQARAWLSVHAEPSQDELAELKTENPTAYAIVKALLTKRALGLLDPKHPSASFAKAPAQDTPATQSADDATSLSDASESATIAASAIPSPPQSSGHHDWLNWKPKDSAADVLEDGSLAATSATSERVVSSGNDDSSSSSNGSGDNKATPVIPTAAPAQTLANAGTETQENSYLKGLDLFGTDSVTKKYEDKQEDHHNYLSSFTWDDDEATQKGSPKSKEAPSSPSSSAAAVASTAAPTTVAKAAPKPKNALLSWLGGGKAL